MFTFPIFPIFSLISLSEIGKCNFSFSTFLGGGWAIVCDESTQHISLNCQNSSCLHEPFQPFWVFWLGLLAVCCPTIVESVGSQLANFTPPPPLCLFTLSHQPTRRTRRNLTLRQSWPSFKHLIVRQEIGAKTAGTRIYAPSSPAPAADAL